MFSEMTKKSDAHGLISYLAKLGLGGEDLTRVISLLHTSRDASAPLPNPRDD
jgi:hypothetical protein